MDITNEMKVNGIINIDLTNEEHLAIFHNNNEAIIDIQFLVGDSGVIISLTEKQLINLKYELNER